MKFDETMAKMTPEERVRVLELLRGKADMNKKLLMSDLEEKVRRMVPQNADTAIKAIYMLCDALVRKGKNIHGSVLKADLQERYHEVGERIVDVIEMETS